MKDLRDLNEQEFKEVYEYVKERTNNFKVFSPNIITENNQFLLIIRACLGLSRKEFANKLNVCKDWCKYIESKRRKIINIKIARRYGNKIEALLVNNKISFEEALTSYKKYLFLSKNQNLQEPEIKFKKFSELNEKDVIEYFNIVKRETKNFSQFKSDLLIRIPQSLIIFRKF